MDISHHENNWIEFSARKQTYILRLGQPEYYFTKGKMKQISYLRKFLPYTSHLDTQNPTIIIITICISLL